jgi:hypothetical protein
MTLFGTYISSPCRSKELQSISEPRFFKILFEIQGEIQRKLSSTATYLLKLLPPRPNYMI